MIDKLYGKYFQKSRSFLYPALGIKRTGIKPSGTYISLEGKVNPEDVKLVCTFKNDISEKTHYTMVLPIFRQVLILD